MIKADRYLFPSYRLEYLGSSKRRAKNKFHNKNIQKKR